ncbi:MAG: hypothetical protein F6K11_18310 [Leptolyngbya sp. SIO3F4]|nr:hypothetical protein [Leptolyngbya sp. SIO3F4]
MDIQTEIVHQIIDQDADYVLSLKGNQGSLHDDVKQLFDWARQSISKTLSSKPIKPLCDNVHLYLGFTLVCCSFEYNSSVNA